MKHISYLSFLLVCILALPAHAQDITTGLVGHWKLDETSGSSIADSAGSNTGTWTDGADNDVTDETIIGEIGTALDFDGTDDKIEAGSDASLDDIWSGGGTITAWIYGRSDGEGGYGRIADKSNGSAPNNGWDLYVMDDPGQREVALSYDFTGADADFRTNLLSWSLNTWFHVAVTYDNSSASNDPKFYINGVEHTDTSKNAPTGSFVSDASHNFTIGNRAAATDRTFDGYIDDVRAYNRILSAEDIAEIYNKTQPGSIRYQDETEAVEYNNGFGWIHAGLGSYSANAVTFDGTNDYISTTNIPSGGKKITGSIWVRRNATGVTFRFSESEHFSMNVNSTGSISVVLKNSSNTLIRNCYTPIGGYDDLEWHHILFSFDMNDSASQHLYIDGVDDLQTCNNYTDEEFSLGTGTLFIGRDYGGAGYFDGDLADFWIDVGTYLDLSVAGNREKFRSANGMPMFLGEDGSLPTGYAPDLYFTGDTADWHTNKGTDGDFTETGALTDAATHPDNGLSNWVQVGSDLNISGVGGIVDISTLNSTNIAFVDSSNEQLRTYSWNGSNWSQTGNGLSLGVNGASNVSVAALDSSTVALSYGSQIITYSWDGSDWSQVGNALSYSGGVVLTALDSTTIALNDGGNQRTYSWDGSDWSSVGSSLGVVLTEIEALDSSTIAGYLIDFGGDQLRTYSWNGSTWSQVGNNLIIAGATLVNAGIAALDSSTVAFIDDSNDDLRTYSWDGSDWSQVGSDLNISSVGSPALAALDAKNIAFIDITNDDLRTYQFAQCTSPAEVRGSIIYNTDENVMQYCNGVDWVAMGPTGVTSGSGCSNPTGAAGDIIFNTDYSVLQYCNSDEWIGIGTGVYNAPTKGLVGYWTLDETSGTTAADSIGSNDGTLVNMTLPAQSVAGKVGTAFDFDNNNDRVDIASNSAIDDVFAGGGTWAVWVYAHSGGEGGLGRIMDKRNDGGFLSLMGSTARDLFIESNHTGGDGLWQVNSAYDFYKWHHVVVTYDSDNISNDPVVYIDGVSQTVVESSTPAGTAISDIGSQLSIGNRNNTTDRTFDGYIDDVRVYNRILTAAEARALYFAGR